MTGIPPKVRSLVVERDDGSCRRCGHRGQEIQHRVARGAGGTSRLWVNTDPSNLVLMCSPCHHWAERVERELARLTGWRIPLEWPELPSEIPLVDLSGRQLFLTEEGEAFYASPAGFLPGDPALHITPF